MSRYAADHIDPQGPQDARPNALQIIKDEGMEGKLVGKVAVITGVSSGLGIETTKALASTGARLYLTARDLDKAKAALGDAFDNTFMELDHMDHTSLDSVRNAAAAILTKTSQISILVANAGVMAIPDCQLTDQGHELQFVTNHLAHFLLFELLKPALLAGSSQIFQSRVVMVSSAGHRLHGIEPADNYHFQKGGYEAWVAYAQSKTANIYMANEIERRYGTRGLHATSLNPGFIATGLGKYLPEETIKGMLNNTTLMKAQKSIEQGAATTVWAALSRELEGKGGLYLNDCAVADYGEYDEDPINGKSVDHTFSSEEEARLWKDSLEMVGLSEDR
ncbi:hypothetical protein N7462_010843 [Penicillium macrosclerotiorum]|uniref:uncharacterized protein n=1 Tax=Penicillium macrosclerotiorum TaxID=303699 RepID=UPI002547B097|nr:uncharacterized protein N7462_010843 [Penicillium macrosclerotiorum]KAJ5669773.1 hypothetical protein N7462_010843 [Penicillium macrosclerotiorum]